MNTLASIIEDEETSRRNKLREHCNDQLTAAIRTGNILSAIILVRTLFCFDLTKSRHIVDGVRAGQTFVDAEFHSHLNDR